jgi:hypothetical protein
MSPLSLSPQPPPVTTHNCVFKMNPLDRNLLSLGGTGALQWCSHKLQVQRQQIDSSFTNILIFIGSHLPMFGQLNTEFVTIRDELHFAGYGLGL